MIFESRGTELVRLLARGGGVCALRLQHPMCGRGILGRHLCWQRGTERTVDSDRLRRRCVRAHGGLLGEKPDHPLTVDLEQQTIHCGDGTLARSNRHRAIAKLMCGRLLNELTNEEVGW